MAKAKGKAEKFASELGEILKKRLTELEAKELIEMGFYTTQGIILFAALGEIVHSNETQGRQDWQRENMTEYFLQLIRGNLVELFKGMKQMGEVNIFWTGFMPLRPLSYMAEPFWYIMDVRHWKRIVLVEGEQIREVAHWKAVPLPIRALLCVAIPSLEYIIIELVKGTIEIG